jgi:tRNA-specific 2-thiouridylase
MLIKKADELNCRFIATGHYVRKAFHNGRWLIRKGLDPQKDQSYFLWNLDQNILQRALFPLGEHTKEEVREIARKKGYIQTARQKESMGVCFLKDNDYRHFITKWAGAHNIPISPGPIVDKKGNKMGHHPGIPYFTIGQKRGLGLQNKKLAVNQIHAESNQIVVSDDDSPGASDISIEQYYLAIPLEKGQSRHVSIRIRGFDKFPPIPGKIKSNGRHLQVSFSKQANGLTPGQSLVFYDNDLVLGGGIL